MFMTAAADLPGDMDFAHRLAAIRKQRGLTQQALAERVGIHVSQIRRYEAGDSQPTLDALRNLAVALSVSTDALVFDETERGPDDDLRLQFEATARLDDEGKALVKALLEAVLLRQEARRWAAAS
jgi:transcriptional regulator with XRE-family HTH domain